MPVRSRWWRVRAGAGGPDLVHLRDCVPRPQSDADPTNKPIYEDLLFILDARKPAAIPWGVLLTEPACSTRTLRRQE